MKETPFLVLPKQTVVGMSPQQPGKHESDSQPLTSCIRQKLRSCVYDAFVDSSDSYHLVLDAVPVDTHLLIIGIGTGRCVIENSALLISKNISIVAIDSDKDYVHQCHENIQSSPTPNLKSHIRVYHADIHSFTSRCRYFDHILFASNVLHVPRLSERLRTLVDELLIDREDGRIYFTHVFQLCKSPWFEFIGNNDVIYEQDFEDCIYDCNLAVVDMKSVHDSSYIRNVRERRVIETRSRLYVVKTKETLN